MVASNASVAQLRTKGFVDTLKSRGWLDDDIASIVYTPELKMSRWEASKQFIEWLNKRIYIDKLTVEINLNR